ncbi:hypothetical protein PTTG_00409 [Puccinia triticina 1-1 BBBD Race 1]|uniref:Uncharacterized protein n=1 Tax=Puccinia triticina (isolate 1-1 / race 1 (BBBD)) TaxID=630390 RepID=A0A180G884_PUCT1|nr:hypothetical protein PTTG_00409 [Puccinia triticina 1-1 BBBD Race 1]
MLAGFSELYAFVKALETDHSLRMRRVPIRYGITTKDQKSIAQSIGWIKPTKRQRAAMNDGRPPDTCKGLTLNNTTEALPDGPNKRAKLGRPRNSQNINREAHTTYASYAALNNALRQNQCWLAASLDSLYAVYTPLWLQSPGGKKNDLFHIPLSHFASRLTNELVGNKSLKTILTRGSNQLFEAACNLHPTSFVAGEYSSADFFMEILLDPKANSSEALQTLFAMEEHRVFSCPRKQHSKPINHPRSDRVLALLKITQAMFDSNGIGYADVGALITLWASSGLAGTSGLQCQTFNTSRSKKSRPSKPQNPDDIARSCLEELSTLSFPNGKSPPHLYFNIDSTSILDEQKQAEFVAQMSWPFKLTVSGEEYTLISCGYWGAHHYWGKMVDPATFVKESNERIRRDNPKISSGFPFEHLQHFLNISYNGDMTGDDIAGPAPSANPVPKPVISRRKSTKFIGDNISSPLCSEDWSEDLSDHSGEDEESTSKESLHSDFQAVLSPQPSQPVTEPIKIRLRLNNTDSSSKSYLQGPYQTEPAFKSSLPLLFHHSVATSASARLATGPCRSICSIGLGSQCPLFRVGPQEACQKTWSPSEANHIRQQISAAPLSSADWERIAARLAANWKAHFTAENVKLQAQNPGNPRKSLLIDLGNLASSWSDRPTATSHKDTPSQNSAPSDEVVASQKAAGTHKAMAAWRAAAAREKISAVKSKVPTRRSSCRVS